jgi:fructokinase
LAFANRRCVCVYGFANDCVYNVTTLFCALDVGRVGQGINVACGGSHLAEQWGGVEAGGTKFVCVVGSGPDDILAEVRIPTTNRDETLMQVIEFFKEQTRSATINAIGVGSFGPIDQQVSSPTYGYITSTPKPGWENTDIVRPLQRELGVPIAFDTDVNAAALGEHQWGAGQGLDDFIYLTVGTGIGGGAMVNGQLVHGLVHPEMGHVRIPHDWKSDPFPGTCAFHGDCLEGLASGPAMEERWGISAKNLPADHEAWLLEAHYLALGLIAMISVLSPQRIIMGGGIMNTPYLLPMIHREVQELLNDYVQAKEILVDIDKYIVTPALGRRVGVLGAIALAQQDEKRFARNPN